MKRKSAGDGDVGLCPTRPYQSIEDVYDQTHSFVIEKLMRWKGYWARVHDGTGISRRTIEKIARKEIRNPNVRHLETLATFLDKTKAPPLKERTAPQEV